MCVYSMVSEHYQQQWPGPQDWSRIAPRDYQNYQELVRKARLYDEMMKQPDCPDPQKQAWQSDLEKFMREKYGMEPKT